MYFSPAGTTQTSNPFHGPYWDSILFTNGQANSLEPMISHVRSIRDHGWEKLGGRLSSEPFLAIGGPPVKKEKIWFENSN